VLNQNKAIDGNVLIRRWKAYACIRAQNETDVALRLYEELYWLLDGGVISVESRLYLELKGNSIVKTLYRSFKKMKTTKKLSIIIAFGILLCAVSPVTSYATAYVSGWNLVDSGKHLDYDGNSKYMSNIDSGASKWNAYRSGVIRKDSLLVVQDVYVSDVSVVNNVNATTSNNGTIKMNIYNLDKQTSTQVTRVATHELGHALGCDHSTSADIMYANTIATSSLTQNDKDSYDAAYATY